MDHPCHKCGHSIEDGKPFCAQCGAPQIRVAISEAAEDPVTAGDGAVPALPHEMEASLRGVPSGSLAVSRSHTLKPCALAAAVAVLVMFLGLNPFVAALAAGCLAVIFFRRRGALVRPPAGARLGAFSGFLLFGVSTIFETFAVAVLHKGAEIRTEVMDKVQQAVARYPGPEVQPFLDFAKSPDGFAFLMIASLIFGFVVFVVLGSIGGALSAAFLGRNDPG
jgi:hypothetical protein